MLTAAQKQQLDWEKVSFRMPAIVQHARSGSILMLGYMTPESLERTEATGKVTFFSRSRQQLWTKGETSGNFLSVQSIHLDCDHDTLLIKALPHGPVCHLGTTTCFSGAEDPFAFLWRLEEVLAARKNADPATSYTAQLYAKGTKRIAQKVGEEGVETALAAVAESKEVLISEASDLLYHLLVLLQAENLSLQDVIACLKKRHQ